MNFRSKTVLAPPLILKRIIVLIIFQKIRKITPFASRHGIITCLILEHMNKCELAKYVWHLKDNGKTFDVQWRILKKVNGRLVGGACKLCTSEKLLIIEHPNKDRLLNANCIQKCRHDAKYLLSGISRVSGRARNNNTGIDTMD